MIHDLAAVGIGSRREGCGGSAAAIRIHQES